MGQTQGSDGRQRKEEKKKTLEDRYWRDFIFGVNLEKYGKIRTVKHWQVDKNIVSHLFLGAYR